MIITTTIHTLEDFKKLFIKYMNLTAELEIAHTHRLSKKIIKSLNIEQEDILHKINKIKFSKRLNKRQSNNVQAVKIT